MKRQHLDRIDLLFLGLLTVLAGLLMLTNLDHSLLWQDEAQTALISKTILDHGVPRGYDGTNYLSQELGAEYGANHIYKWHTWFSFYVVAASFKLFGPSTISARLPFALFGMASIPLLYLLCRQTFTNRRYALFAALLLLFSVPFLLLSRQCRYYSMTAFFALLTALGYQVLLQRPRSKVGPLCFIVGAVALFQSLYLYFATLLAAVVVDTLIWHRQAWRRIFGCCAIAILLNVPWIIWLSGMNYTSQYAGNMTDLSRILFRLINFSRDINDFALPTLLLAGTGAVLLWQRRRQQEPASANPLVLQVAVLPALFSLFTLAALAIAAPAPFFRYLAPLLPFTALLAALCLQQLAAVHQALPLLILFLLIGRFNLYNYARELSTNFIGPMEGITAYLNQHARPTDTVAVTYGDMPIKFYTGLRVIGGLTGENLSLAQNADWILIRANVICEKDLAVRNYLLKNVSWARYRKIILDAPDTAFENRESPTEHLFTTAKDAPPVLLFKKLP